MLNRLVQEVVDNDDVHYQMQSFDITVKAHQSTSITPVLTYWLGAEEVTKDVLALRLSPQLPSSYIDDYAEFQTMLHTKEQQAIQTLYDQFSIVPNLPKGKHKLLWALGVGALMFVPLLIVAIF